MIRCMIFFEPKIQTYKESIRQVFVINMPLTSYHESDGKCSLYTGAGEISFTPLCSYT